MEKYHETASHYTDILENTRKEMVEIIKSVLKQLGGRVCVRHYHEWEGMERYTFFTCDCEGYGVEFFLDTIITNERGEIEVMMHNIEDSKEPFWTLDVFTATETLYLLRELEAILIYVEDKGYEVVKDYNPDYTPENW